MSEYLSVKRPRLTSKNPAERKLAQALRKYTDRGSNAYDAEFNTEIRALQPYWFIDGVAENKKKLLELARSNAKRPSANAQNPATTSGRHNTA